VVFKRGEGGGDDEPIQRKGPIEKKIKNDHKDGAFPENMKKFFEQGSNTLHNKSQ